MNKKILAFILVLIMLFLMACCGKKQENMTRETTIETTQPTTEVPLLEIDGVASIDDLLNQSASEQETTEKIVASDSSPEKTESDSQTTVQSSNSSVSTESTESTKATESADLNNNSNATESTVSSESNEAQDENTSCCQYEVYLTMSAAEQEAYMNTFASPMAFIDWCKSAQAEHESHTTNNVVTGGNLDIGQFVE